MTHTTIRLPESLWRKLRGKAGEAGISANRYLERLLRSALDEPEGQ